MLDRRIVEWSVTALILFRMAVVFFQPPGRFFSWGMFSRNAIAVPRLRDQHGREVNVFERGAPHAFLISLADLQEVVNHLAEHGVDVSGSGIVLWEGGRSTFEVSAGHVAIKGD